ncbi:MAG: acetyl-CoA C-acyltransferase [Rhizomicrobium sp.]|jgi:acetyl-CoA C-acetyltransferase/acetyl-CoA acyltransferase
MSTSYLVPGLRIPFVKAGTHYASHTALDLSAPIAVAMAARARPDFLVWGQVIPDASLSNIARELIFEAKLDPETPAFSDVMACSTSFVGTILASGMVGRSDMHLALVGGVETMSHIPLALKTGAADKIIGTFMKNPAAAADLLAHIEIGDFDMPIHGWANRVSGRSMGEHTEETAQRFNISRADQDKRALLSHRGAIKGQDDGFFNDIVLPFGDVDHDTIPRRDTSLEKLASLRPVFDHSDKGTLTAGNSSPNTDGAASIWVADEEGLKRLGNPPRVKLVDWEIAAMNFLEDGEGILMAPARAIPRLLARNKLKALDIALWEIHEAFAAQVLANIKEATDDTYRRAKAKVNFDIGSFPWERVNPHGGSLAIGHPFAATGARILSQATKELAAMPAGSYAMVSVCADGGQGTVALLQRE